MPLGPRGPPGSTRWLHKAGYGGTPNGQHIDIVELTNQDGDISVIDVIGMTLPMEGGALLLARAGPDGALYAAVDEGVIHKLMPRSSCHSAAEAAQHV